jgi:hypothetical protein
MSNSKTETKELEKLRAEIARLKADNIRLEESMTGENLKRQRKFTPTQLLRKLGVVFLITFATALITFGNLLFWFGNTVVKPDRFAAATQPIIKDPKVQNTMALYTTNKIFDAVDVEKFTEQALPPRAGFLAPQLASQIKSTTQKTLQKTLAKPTFQEKWNVILATQHERIVNFASKYNGDGTISLNDVYNQLSASLKSTKLAFLSGKKLPAKVGTVEVVNATWLPAFHNLVVNIDTWRLLAVILFVICVALAVWLGKNKRKTLYTICISSSIFMILTLVALRVMRETIAQKADPQYADGVRSAMQIFFHPLLLQTATLFFVFVFVAIVAWVSSPARSAAAVREKVGLLFSGKLHARLFGEEENKYIGWVSHNKHLLEWGIVTVVALIMLLVRLTLKSLILYAFAMLICVLTIEVIAGRPQSKYINSKRSLLHKPN